MVDVQLRERERDNYLLALYELADGRTANTPSHREIAHAARIPDKEVMLAGQDLVDQGLCKFATLCGLDGRVSITQAGIAKAERQLTGGQLASVMKNCVGTLRPFCTCSLSRSKKKMFR
jgi:hypothetical protein